MLHRFLAGALLALAGLPLAGQEPAAAPTLGDADWLTGKWHTPSGVNGAWEEHWSLPRFGAMIGMFRLREPAANVYEFLLIEEGKDGVWMRLRHFSAKMQDVDKEPLRLKLISAADKKLVFENPDHEKLKRITYQFEAPSGMSVTIEGQRDGKPASGTLKFVRAREK
jgi:Domain of unknown function (DUF6265)